MQDNESEAAPPHVLLLGEADFSFARAMGRRGGLEKTAVTATELGTPADVSNRYFSGSVEELGMRCDELHSLGVRVVLGVDVCRLECNDTCHHWMAKQQRFVEAPLWSGCDDAAAAAAAGLPPVSQVVFNFPHTTRPGKTAKLLAQMFRSIRVLIARGFAHAACDVELRLRHVSSGEDAGKLIRSQYGHDEAAAAACFDAVSVDESDLHLWPGYEHRSTKRNARCGHLDLVNMHRWRAAPMRPPSVQPLPLGCNHRRDVFFTAEAIVERRMVEIDTWKGGQVRAQYLVRWRGHPSPEEYTWEDARDLDVELRKDFEEALAHAGNGSAQAGEADGRVSCRGP